MDDIFNSRSVSAFRISVILTLFLVSIINADPIGEIHIAGNTWRELQFTAFTDDMIVLDTSTNTVYLTWTYSPYENYDIMRSYFNSYNPQTGWAYAEPGFWMLEGVSNVLEHSIMLPNNAGGIANLEFGLRSIQANYGAMRVWWENGTFNLCAIDSINDLHEYEIRRTCSNNGMVHILAKAINFPYNLFYGRYNINPYSFSGWEFVDSNTTVLSAIATSSVSERTAIAYFKQRDFSNHLTTWDRDVYLITSTDGANWNWQDKLNITNFTENDVFRATECLDLIFDYNDQLHAAFATWECHVNTAHPESTTYSPYRTVIWHWSEGSDSISIIANGWMEELPPPWECSFTWYHYTASKPKLSIDPESGYIYAIYERNSCDDVATVARIPNTDLWATVSTDNGLNWSEGINFTYTQTPLCLIGECSSEIQASMDDLVNDTLHIAYVLDKYPGIYEYMGIFYLESKIIYQKIPAVLIPVSPIIPQFSIRSDPTTAILNEPDLSLPSFISGLFIYPNPFNTNTKIGYELKETCRLKISIFNILGQEITTLFEGNQKAGCHDIIWQAIDLPSGIYFIHFSTEFARDSFKAVLIK